MNFFPLSRSELFEALSPSNQSNSNVMMVVFTSSVSPLENYILPANKKSLEQLITTALFRYSLNGQIKPMPVPYIPSDTRVLSSNTNSSSSAVSNGMANGNNGYIIADPRPDSRYSNRSRDRRSRSRSRHRSRSKHRARAHVQSSSSGQSGSTQYSRADSTGRLVTNGNPRLL